MTNLQAGAGGGAPNPWIRRLLFWLPLGTGGLLGLLVLAIGAVPLLTQVQLQSRQQEEKTAIAERLPQLRLAQARTAAEQQAAEQQQQRLLALIAGSGDLITFMAQADREARRHGVDLQLYEPTTAQAAAAADGADALKGQGKGTRSKAEQDKQAKQEAEKRAQSDPLQKAGLQNTQLLLSASGSYPSLLAFLRAMERLSLLVVQSNLNLSQADAAAGTATAPATAPATATKRVGPVVLKMAVSLYSRKPTN